MARTRERFETAAEAERTEPAATSAGPDPAGSDVPARSRILAAAESLFAERGFDHTSTARIASEAGVPHGLIFYHFTTKMDLLLALIRDDRVIVLDGLLPALDTPTDLRQAVIELWIRLSALLGQPSAVRRIIIQELTAHPEVRQRAMELHNRIVAIVSHHLAQASRATGCPRPEHEAAARLLTIAAGMAPLLGEPSLTLVRPEALATLLSDGLTAG
ncbi:MAG TPA: helix-turn-helix domain-containing protein [Streptosporangiaceae bacterium]